MILIHCLTPRVTRAFNKPFLYQGFSSYTKHCLRQNNKVKQYLKLFRKPKRKLTLLENNKLVVLSTGSLFCLGGLALLKNEFKATTAICDSEVDENNISSTEDLYAEAQKVFRNFKDSFDWQRLWQLVRPDVFYLIIAIASSFIVAFLNIQIPISLGSLMNVLSRYASDGTLWKNEFFTDIKAPAIRVVEMYLFQSFFTFVYITSLAIVGERLASRVRQELFSSILRQDVAFFDTRKSGEIFSCLTNDVQDFKSSFKLCISQGLRSITQSVGCAISLFIISPKMTVFMVVIIPGMVSVGTLIGSFLRALSKDAQNQMAKAAAIANEAINNVRTVKAFAMEEFESRTYNQEVFIAQEINSSLGIGIGMLQGLTNIALNGIVLTTLLFGGYLLSKEELSPGNLMSFLVATQTIQRSLAQLSLLFGNYVRGTTAGMRIFSYLDLRPSMPLTGIIPTEKPIGEIEFRNVTFSYPTRKEQIVLNDFNLKLYPGKVTALCGLSGAGKSTIASLLEKFYEADEGLIIFDGYDLKQLDPLWLRGEVIGFINQEPVLFGTTIKENIRFGKPTATDEEIYEAARIANADTFIRGFPDGYETVVGERGVTVSGGQKQRISIARAILKNPTLLILDEATSALDVESESLVQEALEKVMKGRTVLVIAHRLSTIANADVIAVMMKGKVVEIGDHNTLKKLRGFYWRLIRQQSDYEGVMEE